MLLYKEIQPISKESACQILKECAEEQLIADVLLSLTIHGSDWEWVQHKCIEYTAHESLLVRRIAIQCIGHLARIHRKIDISLVQPMLTSFYDDPQLEDTV